MRTVRQQALIERQGDLRTNTAPLSENELRARCSSIEARIQDELEHLVPNAGLVVRLKRQRQEIVDHLARTTSKKKGPAMAMSSMYVSGPIMWMSELGQTRAGTASRGVLVLIGDQQQSDGGESPPAAFLRLYGDIATQV